MTIPAAMTIPVCPLHGEMKKVTIECYGRIIGFAWFCVNNDEGSPDYCDNCEDCDDPIPEQEPQQMGMFWDDL